MANVIVGHVSKRFGNLKAVSELSLAIDDGEFVVLLGPSGAGKTTTLRLIAGLEHPDEGSIYIGARDVTRDPPGTRDIAFVFQQYSLYPHLSVYDNLAFPLRSPARRVPEQAIHRCSGTAHRSDGSLRIVTNVAAPRETQVPGQSGRRAGDCQRAGADCSRPGHR
jgi:ABC-type sugar transport system ATPase subunit